MKRIRLNSFQRHAPFFTVGASGLLVNYLVSILLASGLQVKLWYMESTSIGIIVSISSNFILNKLWTFGDSDLSPRYFVKTIFTFFNYLFLRSVFAIGIGLYFGRIQSILCNYNDHLQLLQHQPAILF